MKDTFSGFHPLINFMFFVVVILFTMFMMHPVFLVISMVASASYSIYLNGKKAIYFNLFGMVPLLLMSIIFNPLFNHAGVTILAYFPSGNPFTLESLVYGIAAAVMFISVIMWFSCYNAVMTSDKFIYLFGRVIPGISLIFSMILRFAPNFIDQAKKISTAQKCIGRDLGNGSVKQRAKNGIKIISILTTWALENGIETADSMRSRGYGLPGRTSFSIFRFDSRDRLAIALLGTMVILIFAAIALNQIHILYYPMLIMNENTGFAVVIYMTYGLLCFFPLIIDIVEDIKWHVLKSRI